MLGTEVKKKDRAVPRSWQDGAWHTEEHGEGRVCLRGEAVKVRDVLEDEPRAKAKGQLGHSSCF